MPKGSNYDEAGEGMHALLSELYPIHRSITGAGLRESLDIVRREIPELNLHEFPTGQKHFDWTVPKEWVIREAFIITPENDKICDIAVNNLHVISYSGPVDITLSLDELKPKLHSLPSQPTAIPYLTSYYKDDWGFCITDMAKKRLRPGNYRVYIDSDLVDGKMDLGDAVIDGRNEEEVLFSTYLCHPSMANNELSGPTVAIFLYHWLKSKENLKYSYRFVFCPETIGAIAYIDTKFEELKEKTIAGFVLTCMGDDGEFSFLPSRRGRSLADRAAKCVLRNDVQKFREYSFMDRGSDERQYCSPNVDLPVCSVMRSKYGEYDEYHTSLDDLNFVSPSGLAGSLNIMKRIVDLIEMNEKYVTKTTCEPKLDLYGLYPSMTTKGNWRNVMATLNFLTCCDGEADLIEIGETCKIPSPELIELVNALLELDLIEVNNENP